ncbi:sphingomyelin phosphodiesterase-like isoform X1 [Clavelina lepadiformis]|uniref:sphingomyelin phosphodiesterase-like isoform X1 n=1 Tax=Clavelina lepadiformis TaxID=159417 RepID=UPI004041FD7C
MGQIGLLVTLLVLVAHFLHDSSAKSISKWPIVNDVVPLGNLINGDKFDPKLLTSFYTTKYIHKGKKDFHLKRNIGLLVVRRILNQGDILSSSQRNAIDELVYREKTTCGLCESGVMLLQDILSGFFGEEIITAAVVGACEEIQGLSDLLSERVCEMAVDEFKTEFFYVLNNLKPDELCYWLLGDQCVKPDGFLPEWKVTLPSTSVPTYQPPKVPSDGAPTSKFLFFSDVHMDVKYESGASAVCGEPLCCRDNDPTPSDAFEGAGKWGDYRNCDMPRRTVEGMMEAAKRDDLDFILFAGDIPAHDVWNQTKEDQIDKINRWTTLLKTYFPDTPVYAALGNHESAPVNSYPPSSINHEPGADISWLYDTVYDSWSNWIPENDLATVKQGGFYSTLIRPGLRVVSLNSNYCSDDSWWLLVGDNSVDPQDQLAWFAKVMQLAEDQNESVFIITHRLLNGCIKSWSYNYYDIVNRYKNTIIAQFFGHAHTDELKMYYDENDPSHISIVGFIGPGFTTYSEYSDLNAGYRIYTMDGDYKGTTNSLLDADTYILNMTDANLTNDPKWELEYTFSKDYGMRNLSASEFDKLLDRFDADDEIFQQYYQHSTKDARLSSCDEACKQYYICDIKQCRTGDDSFC